MACQLYAINLQWHWFGECLWQIWSQRSTLSSRLWSHCFSSVSTRCRYKSQETDFTISHSGIDPKCFNWVTWSWTRSIPQCNIKQGTQLVILPSTIQSPHLLLQCSQYCFYTLRYPVYRSYTYTVYNWPTDFELPIRIQLASKFATPFLRSLHCCLKDQLDLPKKVWPSKLKWVPWGVEGDIEDRGTPWLKRQLHACCWLL